MRGRSAAVGALLLLSSAGCGLVLDPSFPRDVPDVLEATADVADDASDVADVHDAGDVLDARDASDVRDAADAFDAPDTRDAADALDVRDALDAPDAFLRDAPEVRDAPDAFLRDVPDAPDAPACPSEFTRCEDGCFNLRTDVHHCGGCDSACAMLPNTLSLCGGGMCAFGGCTAGFGNCDGDPRTGCETTLATDLRHCGACNRPCPMGATCERGACVCPPGRTLCGSTCADLQSDPSHCGACGRACGSAARCIQGMCTAGCTLGDDTEILRRCSSSIACLLGLRCLINQGVCVPDECLTDLACRNGTSCRQETLRLVCGSTTDTVTIRRCR